MHCKTIFIVYVYSKQILVMTTIKSTKQTIHLTVPNTETIDVSKIYSRVFFDAFKMIGYRIYMRSSDGTLTEISSVKTPNSELKHFSDVFGEEQTPNGYTSLPLDYDIEDDEKEEDDLGMLNTITQYVSRFSSQSKEEVASVELNGGILISFPLDVEKPIVVVDDLYTTMDSNTESIFQSSKSSVDYAFIENVLRDLYVQVDYLKQIDVIYTEVNTKSLYRIQDRFILLDSVKLVPIKKEVQTDQEKVLCSSIVNLVAKLLGREDETDFTIRFADIQDTRVFYVLKRLELEGVFEWI